VTALPPTIFSYAEEGIGWHTSGEELATVDRPFLTGVENGYGGTLDFGYETWFCYDYDNSSQVEGETSTCDDEGTPWLQRQTVKTKELSPGENMGVPMTAVYDYDNADVKWTVDPPTGCGDACFQQFIGFVDVTEDWKAAPHAAQAGRDRVLRYGRQAGGPVL